MKLIFLLSTNRAPLLCSISILLTSCVVWGAHTVEAYSIIGSTDVLIQCSLINMTWTGPQIRHRNARAVLPFDNTCLTCSFQVSLESITAPKYLTEFTSLVGAQLMWCMNLRGDILSVTIRNSHFDGLNSIWCILDYFNRFWPLTQDVSGPSV